MIAMLKTDSALLRRIQESARKPASKAEIVRQRVSFVYGNLPNESDITREKVENRIREKAGE